MSCVCRLLSVSLLVMPLTANAGEPFLSKTNLFNAGERGYAIYRIPGIVATTKGSLLCYCEARKNARGDWGPIDIMLRRSTDGGKTWDDARKIVKSPANVQKNPVAVKQKLGKQGEVTQNNPIAIVDRKLGCIHFLYCIEYARCFYMRSDDDGKTFTKPVEITSTFEMFRKEYDWKVLAVGPGHGIQLDNGRLLIPVWLSTGTGGHAHRPSCVSVIYSDDHGKNWRRGDIVVAHPNPVNPSETVPVQLADGRVMFNIRHESVPRFRGVSYSKDGATNWTKPYYDKQLPDPVCMGSIVRWTKKPAYKKNRIVFANPNNPTDRKRKNVTVRLSYDEGKTWPVAKSLNPGVSGYSDLAAGPDGYIYCFYEKGDRIHKNQPQHLCLAKFNIEWLTDGRDHLQKVKGQK